MVIQNILAEFQIQSPQKNGMADTDELESDENQQQYYKIFIFTASNETSEYPEKLEVLIPEVLNPSYGMYTWPAAPVLAQYVWYNRKEFKGKQVLELSAGTALAGTVAALCGAEVTFSESNRFPECLENSQHSCKINNLTNVQFVGITWGQLVSSLNNLPPFQIILASDCFYNPQDFEDIIVTVVWLLSQTSEAKFLCSYQVRCAEWTITDLLIKWGCKCKYIPLSDFEGDSSDIGNSGLPGRSTIELYEITKKQLLKNMDSIMIYLGDFQLVCHEGSANLLPDFSHVEKKRERIVE